MTSSDRSTYSERQVVSTLRAQLRPGEHLLQNVRFTDSDNGDVETDVLLLLPGYGCAVIEVKGGTVVFESNTWWLETGRGRRRIDPIAQARRAKHALRKYADRNGSFEKLIRTEWFIAMPATTIDRDLGPEGRRDLLLGRADMPTAVARIRSVLAETPDNSLVPTADHVAELMSLLSGNGVAIPEPKRLPSRRWLALGIPALALAVYFGAGNLAKVDVPRSASPTSSDSHCSPNYSPCLPLVADINCSDISTSVRVIGKDVYRLDNDGDGVGCESNEASPSASPAATGSVAVPELQPIQSDNVAGAAFDAASQTMYVKFKSGAVYAYSPVTENLWNDFLAAQPHPWSKVGYPRLVKAGVPYRRL